METTMENQTNSLGALGAEMIKKSEGKNTNKVDLKT